MEARALVNPLAFNEHAFHRIDRLIPTFSSNGVDHLDDSAIQSAQQTIATILGKFYGASLRKFLERVVSRSNLFDASTGREIQAQAERYHCTDNECLLDLGGWTFLGFSREVEAPEWVRFPEVNPRTEPVVIVVAFLEGLALQDSLADSFIAPVIAENETRSQLVQRE